eukprot:4251501-Lingulodinium_polyedra.AAC.1
MLREAPLPSSPSCSGSAVLLSLLLRRAAAVLQRCCASRAAAVPQRAFTGRFQRRTPPALLDTILLGLAGPSTLCCSGPAAPVSMLFHLTPPDPALRCPRAPPPACGGPADPCSSPQAGRGRRPGQPPPWGAFTPPPFPPCPPAPCPPGDAAVPL